MFDNIKNNFSHFVQLSDADFETVKSFMQVEKLKQKEFLFQEGDVCKYVYYINYGCVRYFYNADGYEKTGQFFFENAWYSDYASFLSGKPTSMSLQALEATEVIQIGKADIEKLYAQLPKFERFGRLMAEIAVLGLMRKNENLTLLSSEERYLKLIKERPKVIERVSLKYIASYLDIKPESLSRIRKKLSQKVKS